MEFRDKAGDASSGSSSSSFDEHSQLIMWQAIAGVSLVAAIAATVGAYYYRRPQ